MGHLIGNHTWSHKALDTIPADEVIREVQLTHNLIKKYTPETKRQFLGLHMAFTEKTSKILKSNGLKQYSTAIHWDIGGLITTRITADWKCWKEDIEPYCQTRYLTKQIA